MCVVFIGLAKALFLSNMRQCGEYSLGMDVRTNTSMNWDYCMIPPQPQQQWFWIWVIYRSPGLEHWTPTRLRFCSNHQPTSHSYSPSVKWTVRLWKVWTASPTLRAFYFPKIKHLFIYHLSTSGYRRYTTTICQTSMPWRPVTDIISVTQTAIVAIASMTHHDKQDCFVTSFPMQPKV